MCEDYLKRCFKCGEEKSRLDFYRHPQMTDGLLGKCKSCARHDANARRAAKLDEVRAYDRKRGSRMSSEQVRAWRSRFPEKARAHNAVNNAVRDLRLLQLPCEECGTWENVHGHHDNYDKPLAVRWLCAAHHQQHHHAAPVPF